VDLAEATKAYRAAQAAVADAKRRIHAAQDRLTKARQNLAEAVVAEARSGTRQRDIVAVTGLSRERVRQICRDAGLD